MHNTDIPCGCLIEYEGDQTHQDYSINWCPLHAAALDLLNVLLSMNQVAEATGYCICLVYDGAIDVEHHATQCANAQAAINKTHGDCL